MHNYMLYPMEYSKIILLLNVKPFIKKVIFLKAKELLKNNPKVLKSNRKNILNLSL